MAEIKKTKRVFLNELLEIVAGDIDKETFIKHELELLNKKNGSSAKTKTQVENDNIKVVIVEELKAIGTPVTITDLQAKSAKMAEYSNQKLSALLRQLVESNEVVKTTDKKKSYFSV